MNPRAIATVLTKCIPEAPGYKFRGFSTANNANAVLEFTFQLSPIVLSFVHCLCYLSFFYICCCCCWRFATPYGVFRIHVSIFLCLASLRQSFVCRPWFASRCRSTRVLVFLSFSYGEVSNCISSMAIYLLAFS